MKSNKLGLLGIFGGLAAGFLIGRMSKKERVVTQIKYLQPVSTSTSKKKKKVNWSGAADALRSGTEILSAGKDLFSALKRKKSVSGTDEIFY